MKQFTPEEFWQDMIAAATKAKSSPGDLALDTNVVKSLTFIPDGTRLRIGFEDEDGPDHVVVNQSDIQEGTYMRQGEDGGALAWSFETPKGSFTLRTQPKKPPMPTRDGASLTGLTGKYLDGRPGPYQGEAGNTVAVDFHDMVLFEVVDGVLQSVYHVTDAKQLAEILNL